jgi:hypothetical protein
MGHVGDGTWDMRKMDNLVGAKMSLEMTCPARWD